MNHNHWTPRDLHGDRNGRYESDEERAAHLALVRERLRIGHYLTPEAALLTAAKMLHLFTDLPPQPAA